MARRSPAPDKRPLEGTKARSSQRAGIQVALADLLVVLDKSQLPAQFRPKRKLTDREASFFFKSLPRLTPPLSVTVRQERAEQP